METKKTDPRSLRDAISVEFSLIRTSSTIGGALTHLGAFFTKLRRQPHINCIIASAEAELAEEDRIAFAHLERAVVWFHEKIRNLLPHVQWKPDSFAMADVNALLNFHTLSLSANGYVGSLLFELRHLYSEVAKEEKNYPLFEGLVRIERQSVYSVEVFDWPDCVDKTLNSLPPDQQIHRWKERADTSLPCLLRFLKILSLYPTFVPLTLPARPSIDSLPKNLIELEERDCQAKVGYYLSAFRSADAAEHPLSLTELLQLIDRFLYMLEQKLEFDVPKDADSPAQVKVVINQFFFFTESAKTDTAATPPASQEEEHQEDVEPVLPNTGIKEHWRTCRQREDLEKLLSIGKEIWSATVKSGEDMALISQAGVAEEIEKTAKQRAVLLHCWVNNRFLVAAKRTDPRRWENNKYAGLKS